MKLRSILLFLLLSIIPFPQHAAGPVPPRLMLATVYQGGVHVPDYWISEKLDGVRGYWDGRQLRTRGGHSITPPAWFTSGWPRIEMDGELWMGRGRFDETSAMIRATKADNAAWKQVRFMVFDLPGAGGTFDARVVKMRGLAKLPSLQPVPQFRLANAAELDSRLRQLVSAGGEGLMLHHRNGRYRIGRSGDLLKYKAHEDAEARVVAHAPGKGKYAGMLGALVLQRPDGRRFRLGTGFTDAQRADPPPIGSVVTYRFNGLTTKGLPRFARFQRIRSDPPPPDSE